MNKKKSFAILNKSHHFKSPRNKNVYRVQFNHHSIPCEAVQTEYVTLKEKRRREIMYREINGTSSEQQDCANAVYPNDEVMNMMMLSKHYMRPISMQYWTRK